MRQIYSASKCDCPLPAWTCSAPFVASLNFPWQVLRFYGYYREHVSESREETHRTRRLILYYYLEDHTLHVAEPRQDNSGLPQGMYLKRHKVPAEDGHLLQPLDFKCVGWGLEARTPWVRLRCLLHSRRLWYRAPLHRLVGVLLGRRTEVLFSALVDESTL